MNNISKLINQENPKITKIKNMRDSFNQRIQHLESSIDDLIEQDMLKTNNLFLEYQQKTEQLSIKADALISKEILALAKLDEMIKQFELISINIESVNSDIEVINKINSEIPKELQELAFIANKELQVNSIVKEEEKNKIASLEKLKKHYETEILLYKDLSQLTYKKVESNVIQIEIKNISRSNPIVNLVLQFIITDKISLKYFSPRNIPVENYLKYINDDDDITMFLVLVVNEAIKIYNN